MRRNPQHSDISALSFFFLSAYVFVVIMSVVFMGGLMVPDRDGNATDPPPATELSAEDEAEFTSGIPSAAVLAIFMLFLIYTCLQWQFDSSPMSFLIRLFKRRNAREAVKGQ